MNRKMSRILKNHKLIDSPWHLVEEAGPELSASNIIVPLKAYMDCQDQFENRNDVGVWLDSDTEVEDIAGYIDRLPLIALNFPVFTDGRPYSSASIIRNRFGYQGELRATGDIRFDQLEQMYRCGFDAFEFRNPEDLERALSAFTFFHCYYQHQRDPIKTVSPI